MQRKTLPLMLTLLMSCSRSTTPEPATPPNATGESTAKPPGALAYPETKREEIVETINGERVADPYRWLEDVETPDVASWMDAQDALTRRRLGALPGRDALRKRLNELTYLDYVSTPSRYGERYFYTRISAEQEKPVFHFRRTKDGKEETLIDSNALSEDGSVSVHGTFPSHDGKLVAYKLSKNNSDASVMYLRDVDAGTDSEIDVIEGARFAYASWLPDNSGFVYTALPLDAPATELNAHASIRLHKIGTNPKTDLELVPPHGDTAIWMAGYVTQDGHWLIVSRTKGEKTGVSFRDIRGNRGIAGPLTTLVEEGVASYQVDEYKDRFYVTTDEDAPNQRVFIANPKKPARTLWKEIVKERPEQLQGAYIVGGHLVLNYMKDAFSQIEICDTEGQLVRKVELPGLGDASGILGREDDDQAYFHYSSLTEPPTIYETSIASGETKLWDKVDVPVDTSKLESEQLWYTSRDGTKVSMFVVKPKGLELDGTAPTYLYGYGGFNVSMTPSFNARAALWAERGGVFVLTNLRGGGEYGEAWHQAGMGANKQNVFDDFIAAAETLIELGYTSPDRLAISGGSNGGLLVGAAMTQRPDLFAAVVCAVPLLDMVRFSKFGSGATWIPEYGDPENAADFAHLFAYSPYHHVEQDTRYPALLMLSADSDDRVDPMHARKFTAAIQHASNGDRPALLRIEKNAGHGGAGVRAAGVDQSVDTLSFLFDQLGMK